MMQNPEIRPDPFHFAVYQDEIDKWVPLPLGILESSRSFEDVLFSRRSVTEIGACPLDRLSSLLRMSLKPSIISRDQYGEVVSWSAAPSAGARHPIDALVYSSRLFGRGNLFVYNAVQNSLGHLNVNSRSVEAFVIDINKTLAIGEASLIWFIIHTLRTSSKYKNSESLYWRDCGALLACMQYVATDLDLKSCPIGYLANESFNVLFPEENIISGGGLLIGK